MSFSQLRQVLHRSQPLLYRRASHAAAVRFNSTSVESQQPDENDFAWKKTTTSPSAERTTVRPEGFIFGRDKVDNLWKKNSDDFVSRRMRTAPNDAYSGRSVEVFNGDVTQAARLLDRILAQNNVSRDWFTNRRHKQKGEERRRLKSMRWRRRFKQEVGEKVQLVQQIRRRGA